MNPDALSQDVSGDGWIDCGIEDARDFLHDRFGRPLPLDISTCWDLTLRDLQEARTDLVGRARELAEQGTSAKALRGAVACHLALTTMQSALRIATRRDSQEGC